MIQSFCFQSLLMEERDRPHPEIGEWFDLGRCYVALGCVLLSSLPIQQVLGNMLESIYVALCCVRMCGKKRLHYYQRV